MIVGMRLAHACWNVQKMMKNAQKSAWCKEMLTYRNIWFYVISYSLSLDHKFI